MGQFNIRDMPERSLQQLEDIQEWCGYTKTQIVLLAIDRLWLDIKHDRNKRGYIEIRLKPDQIDLQDQINKKCKGVWHPTPREPFNGCIVGVSTDTDTSILDELGVDYKLAKFQR